MRQALFILCMALFTNCSERRPENENKAAQLPSFGVYVCKHCMNKDTVYFYWNLDTNTIRAQNIKKWKTAGRGRPKKLN